jgi:hypothetical protein
MEQIFRQERMIIMLNTDSFDFTLPFSGARVRTDKGGGYLTVYLPHERIGMNDDPFYTISIDDWEADRIITLLHKLMHMTAMQIEVAFVYDDIAEAGIFDALRFAKAGLIGFVQRGRNESYAYIRTPTELAAFLIEKGAFKDVPPMFLDCIDNEELGNKLMEGYTLYLLETSTDGFTEHIHKYESGCYYKCDSRILYKID